MAEVVVAVFTTTKPLLCSVIVAKVARKVVTEAFLTAWSLHPRPLTTLYFTKEETGRRVKRKQGAVCG